MEERNLSKISNLSNLPNGKARRGEKTLQHLLDTGLEAFARYGPEGVSTRHLAKMAGVNSAAIQYYFGSKEGYYLAVVQHLLQTRAAPVLELVADIAQRLERSGRSQTETNLLLSELIQRLAKTVLLYPAARYFASISSREHLHPTKAYELIYPVVERLHRLVSELVAAVLGIAPDSPEAIVRAHGLLGQVMLFRIGATTLCRRLQWDSISEAQAEWIASVLAEMACRSLGLAPPAHQQAGKPLPDRHSAVLIEHPLEKERCSQPEGSSSHPCAGKDPML
ncbi:MAG: CerR family C-terminal domain-containing protein [Thermoguttaceae bacterium]|nr:CerR family C-terminal domain-containing protein [Thermoguttaceae bacterium]MDW8037005.1 CerR family C-terminal domain-containing protein [Thermoguttaceae bacterium]